jgi:hypothetical protein
MPKMPNYTTHYNLIKPLQEDFYNVDDFNANADSIDAALHAGVNAIGGKMDASATPPLRNVITGTPVAGQWYRVASIISSPSNQGATMSVHVSQLSLDAPNHPNGILRIDFAASPVRGFIHWEYINELDPEDFILTYSSAAPAASELWVRITRPNQYYRFNVISEGAGSGNTVPVWTLFNNAAPSSQITPGFAQAVSKRPLDPIVLGTYTGNGIGPRFINLGFTPRGVSFSRVTAVGGSLNLNSLAIQGSSYGNNLVIVENGFNVNTFNANSNGDRYNYAAYR